jgi:hypothetical protein
MAPLRDKAVLGPEVFQGNHRSLNGQTVKRTVEAQADVLDEVCLPSCA